MLTYITYYIVNYTQYAASVLAVSHNNILVFQEMWISDIAT